MCPIQKNNFIPPKMVEWKKLLKNKSSKELSPLVRSDDSEIAAISNGSSNNETEKIENGTSNLNLNSSSTANSVGNLNSPDFDEDLSDDVRNYYYPEMDMESARRALQGKPVGTFLIRKSKCEQAKFTLSIRGDRHVFNVRIFRNKPDVTRENGVIGVLPDGTGIATGPPCNSTGCDSGYHLDAPKHLRKYFPSISSLLLYYSNSPRELIALCASGVGGGDERTTFKLIYPLSKSESRLNLAIGNHHPNLENGEMPGPSRPVTRQAGGSLKAMVKWL